MKRALPLLIALAAAVAMTACSEDEKEEKDETPAAQPAAQYNAPQFPTNTLGPSATFSPPPPAAPPANCPNPPCIGQ